MDPKAQSVTGISRPVALITGARRGLGRAIACSLADAGYDLVINDIVDDEDVARTISELRQRGAGSSFIQHDLSDIGGHKDFVERAHAAFGRIDCLVNNAGVQVSRRVGILDVDADEFDHVVDVNLRGTFFLTQQVAKKMVRSATDDPGVRRAIISITSANSHFASTDKAPYCLAKSALSMMTSLYALELGVHNIAVFEIRPGLIETDMTREVREKYAEFVDQTTLFGRWGKPDDIGRTVASLATGAIPYASGQIVNVDGGMHIPRM